MNTVRSEALRGIKARIAASAFALLAALFHRDFHIGAGAVATQLPFNLIGEARADAMPAGKVEVKRTVCTHCSVGCAIDAVVENGVWVRQEPVFDSPINLGAHCAKGASIREHGIAHDSHRLKHPVKLEGGKWKKITWDQAYTEIADKLKAGGWFGEVAAANGLMLQNASGLKRQGSGPLPPAVVAEVFRTPKDGVASAQGAEPTQRIVFRVTGIAVPAFDAQSAAAKRLLDTLNTAYADDLIAQYVAQLQIDFGVKINQTAMNQAIGRGTAD